MIPPPGRPYPVEKCHLENETKALFLICSPGFDGGLTQTFNLEVKHPRTAVLTGLIWAELCNKTKQAGNMSHSRSDPIPIKLN